jgi:hypothetical protein
MKVHFFRVCLPILLAVMMGACTPLRSTIKPPYVVNGKQYSEPELQQFALERCVAVQPGAAPPPHVFTTDGCSVWPDSTWRGCCIDHDIKYWCGADVRKNADQDFRSCVRANSSATNAALMYGAVRVGGGRWSPFPWRWGYGYKWPHPAK